MSATLSGFAPIAAYLSIVKNEAKDVAQMVKTDPAIKRTVAAFQKQQSSISQPADLLAPKNQAALQVVLGAYNKSGQSTETGLLKKLLTQDPSAKGSLVRSLASSDDLHFVKSMTNRATISMSFGSPAAASFVTGGGAASSIAFHNLAWNSTNAQITGASPAKSWSYVLNDGSAAASIATALTTALQSTGTTDKPVTASYGVNSAGTIVGTSGAPAISVTPDSAGNSVYGITLASDSKGAPIRQVAVVSVTAVAGAPGTTASATALLSKALAATGFNVMASKQNSLNILNPVDNGLLSLSQESYTSFAAIAPHAIATNQTVLPLGSAGQNLRAGQVLTSGGSAIGTIKSVDRAGDVTLAAASALSLAAGARIDVAIGAGVANIGTSFKAATSVATTQAILPLGSKAAGMQAGQIITNGSSVVGIVKSVDPAGNVTLQANAAVAVAAGDTLTCVPLVTDKLTPALQDASNVASILSNYETSQYEAKQGQQIPGLDAALYFTRTMKSITSITQLMSDKTLLKVITTNLGLADTFGQLPYSQQLSLLTSKIKLSAYSNPGKLQHDAERFLATTAEQNAAGASSGDSILAQLTGNGSASGSDGLISALYPGSSTSSSGLAGLLGALYA